MIKLRGKQIIVATLSGLLVLGASFTANAKAKKVDNRFTVVNVALKPTSETNLTNYVYDTVNPDSANFHQYLTPNEFAQKFGQSGFYVAAFKKYLRKYHLKTNAYAGNLSLKVRGTKHNVNRAFKAKYVNKSKTSYQLPGYLSKQVVAVIGIYAANPNSAKKKTTKKQPTKKPAVDTKSLSSHVDIPTSDTKPDTTLSGNSFSKKYGPAKFANRYQLNRLYNQGLAGQGQRIGLIVHTDFRNSNIQKYWQQVGVNSDTSRLHRVYVAGSPKNVTALSNLVFNMAQVETTLDVESASSVAPKADIDAYIDLAPSGATTNASGHYTAFMQAVSDNVDNQISTSFSPGEEAKSGWEDKSANLSQYNHAFNLMLEQAAAQGITVFRAGGDHGPYDVPGTSQINAVSTSPYQVMVGGTTLPYTKIMHQKLINVNQERAWGDTYSASASDLKKGFFPGGGAGGFSALNPTPRYQLGVPGVNTFRAIQLLKYIGKGHFLVNKNPKVITGTRQGRNFPDVSGNADPQTGYATYIAGNSMTKKHKRVVRIPYKIWLMGGGTSYTTPQMTGANAVMNSGRSTRIGFWNPQIYKFAQETDSPFNVLAGADNNNNLYYTGQPGKIYNQASGLGTINFEKLNAEFNSEGSN
ncbi:MAG: protease pro-enzyme activation domain-containing protein [Lentilactobacillus diolivorans]